MAQTEPGKYNQTSKSYNIEISCPMQLPKVQYKTDLDIHPKDSKTVRLIRGVFFREERLNRGFTVTTTAIFSMS